MRTIHILMFGCLILFINYVVQIALFVLDVCNPFKYEHDAAFVGSTGNQMIESITNPSTCPQPGFERKRILEMDSRASLEMGVFYHSQTGVIVPVTLGQYIGNYFEYNRDVTLVSAITADRVVMIQHIISKWDGPIRICICIPKEKRESLLPLLREYTLSKRIMFILYYPKTSDFPVNLLRNIGIRSIETSHFIVLDIDLLPTPHLYTVLKAVIATKPIDRHGVVVPIVFLNEPLIYHSCDDYSSCIAKSVTLSPQSKKELEKCIVMKKCFLKKKNIDTHLLLDASWFDIPSSSLCVPLSCFPPSQEPYMMLQYTSSIPLFDERFINYGYNKIQYMEQLMYYLREISILSDAFVVDMVHPKSSYAASFEKGRGWNATAAFTEFMGELGSVFKASHPCLPLCQSAEYRVFNKEPSI